MALWMRTPVFAQETPPQVAAMPPHSLEPANPEPDLESATAEASATLLLDQAAVADPESVESAEPPGHPEAEEGVPLLFSTIVDVTLNQVAMGTFFLAEDASGALYATQQDLEDWGLLLPATLPDSGILMDGARYLPLNGIPGADYHLDPLTYGLQLTVPGESLPHRRYGADKPPPMPQPGSGLALDYSLSVAGAEASRLRYTGLLEASVFRQGWTASFSSSAAFGDEADGWRRLTTALQRDQPESLRRLSLGDAILPQTAWGSGLRFGGLRLATEFSLQPGLLTFPLPTVEGVAQVPSVVDLYLDDRRILDQEVDAGPFTLDHLPLTSGAGELRMVVRDSQGREQTVAESFYISRQLLKAGLSSYSLALGALREDYGRRDFGYGAWIADARYRRGLSDTLTLGGVVQASGDRLAAALSVDAGSLLGEASVATAFSHAAETGLGAMVELGARYQARRFHLSGTWSQWSANFRVPGVEDKAARRRQQLLSAGLNLNAWGSVSLIHANRRYWDDDDLSRTTLSYRKRLTDWLQVDLSASTQRDGDDWDRQLGLNFHVLFDRRSGSLYYRRSQDGLDLSGEFSQSLPAGTGYGYRFQADRQGLDAGELAVRTGIGTHRLTASDPDSLSWRIQTEGSLTYMDREFFLAPATGRAFALVDVADYPEVMVKLENQPIARTNSRGSVLLPNLRPYEENRVGIEQRDLPIDANVETLEVIAVPYADSGVRVEFPVSAVSGVVLQARQADGGDIPLGALVTVEGGGAGLVGYDGLLYLEGIYGPAQLHISWEDNQCLLSIPPTPEGELTQLGALPCQETIPVSPATAPPAPAVEVESSARP